MYEKHEEYEYVLKNNGGVIVFSSRNMPCITEYILGKCAEDGQTYRLYYKDELLTTYVMPVPEMKVGQIWKHKDTGRFSLVIWVEKGQLTDDHIVHLVECAPEGTPLVGLGVKWDYVDKLPIHAVLQKC